MTDVFDFDKYYYEVVMHITSERRKEYYIRRVHKSTPDPTFEVVLCRHSIFWSMVHAEKAYILSRGFGVNSLPDFTFINVEELQQKFPMYLRCKWNNLSTPQDLLMAESPSSNEVVFSTRDLS